MKEPWLFKVPMWAWACLIAAMVLAIMILASKEELPDAPDLTGLSCDEMIENYERCVVEQNPRNEEYRSLCKKWYVQNIVDCYGESILNDQMALLNSTPPCLYGAGPLLPGQEYCDGEGQ